MVHYLLLKECDMFNNNDSELNLKNNLEKIDRLISRLYWEAKCGRAAAEFNLKEAGMIKMTSGHIAGQMRDGDNFWDDCRWTVTERGRCTSMADLQRIIVRDPPLEIALWDAKDEATDVAGGCGGCQTGDPILAAHQRILLHLEKRVERIVARLGVRVAHVGSIEQGGEHQ
jgi:hypothetical protein